MKPQYVGTPRLYIGNGDSDFDTNLHCQNNINAVLNLTILHFIIVLFKEKSTIPKVWKGFVETMLECAITAMVDRQCLYVGR